MEATEPNTLFCVTSDDIIRKETLSFTYLGELPRELRDKHDLTRLPWGHLWKEGGSRDRTSYPFNVLQQGRLIVGGGFDADGPASWHQEMLDAIPSCTLLMDTKHFEWLETNVLKPLGRTYQRIHIDHPVSTHAGA